MITLLSVVGVYLEVSAACLLSFLSLFFWEEMREVGKKSLGVPIGVGKMSSAPRPDDRENNALEHEEGSIAV